MVDKVRMAWGYNPTSEAGKRFIRRKDVLRALRSHELALEQARDAYVAAARKVGLTSKVLEQKKREYVALKVRKNQGYTDVDEQLSLVKLQVKTAWKVHQRALKKEQ